MNRHLCFRSVQGTGLALFLLLSGLLTASADVPSIYNFDGSHAFHGSDPESGLVLGSDGNFYGTTGYGGNTAGDVNGDGTVFKLTPAGVLTTLIQFHGSNGKHPTAALVLGRDGSFYGTTYQGGSGRSSSFNGDGTVFKLTTDGTAAGTTLTTLVNFNGPNGVNPFSTLVQGRDGNFYGTTAYGGGGTVFKMTPAGALTTLVSFNGANGSFPNGALVQIRDGSFYGVTQAGGSGNAGTVFKLMTDGTAAGTLLTTLVNFNYTNGGAPRAALVLGHDGNFYGTTSRGGSGGNSGSGGAGTVFKMTPAGALTTLVSFNIANGSAPIALTQDSNGSFYGTTQSGGSSSSNVRPGAGTVFKLTTDGTAAGTFLTTLVNFNYTNGQSATGGLAQGNDGSFYGTTPEGGHTSDSAGFGTVFKIGPPVAYDGGQTTPKNQPAPIALTYFDTDGNQNAQSIALSAPAFGTLVNPSLTYDPVSGEGIIHAAYTPNTGFTGTDSVYFTVTNGFGVSSAGTYRLFIGFFPLQSLKFNPPILMGGDATIGEVTLTNPATTATTVTLTSSNPAVLPVRSSVTITAGHRTAHFAAIPNPVTVTTDVVITATLSGVSTSSSVTVSAPAAPLSFVTASPTSIVGGSADASGAVALALPTSAPVTVTLTSSNPSVLTVRPSVTVTAGHRMALFTAFSHAVTTAQTLTITAVAGGATKTTTVTVIP